MTTGVLSSLEELCIKWVAIVNSKWECSNPPPVGGEDIYTTK